MSTKENQISNETTKKKNQKNIHDGHRARLRKLVCDAKIENVSNIQAVEAFLTFIFPRGDVNPLAHKLLDRYGSFSNIIDAPMTDLMQVKGIKETTARKITLYRELQFYYTYSKMEEKICLKNTLEFLDFLEQLLRFEKTEMLYFLALDNSFNLIMIRKTSLKQVRSVGFDPLDLYSFLLSSQPAYVAVAHNHPGGTAKPSQDDIEASSFVKNLLQTVECKYIDSMIVGNDGIYSINQDGFLRNFYSINKVLNLFTNEE